jgi:hypothetical protein
MWYQRVVEIAKPNVQPGDWKQKSTPALEGAENDAEEASEDEDKDEIHQFRRVHVIHKDLEPKSIQYVQHMTMRNPGGNAPCKTVAAILGDQKLAVAQGFASVTSKLNGHLQVVGNKLKALSQESRTSDEEVAQQKRYLEDMDSVKRWLAICAQLIEKTNKLWPNDSEDIASVQVIATLEDLVTANSVVAKSRAASVVGQMSDASLQQLSRDRKIQRVTVERTKRQKGDVVANFSDRDGMGRKLS